MLLMGVANARPPLRVPNRISDFYVHCSGTHQIKRADLKSYFPSTVPVSRVGKQFELFGKCSESVQTPSLTALHTICCLLSDDVIRGEFVEGFDLFVVRNGCSCRWNSCSAICIPPLSTRRTAPTDLGLAAC